MTLGKIAYSHQSSSSASLLPYRGLFFVGNSNELLAKRYSHPQQKKGHR
jgi:hypothetical protein